MNTLDNSKIRFRLGPIPKAILSTVAVVGIVTIATMVPNLASAIAPFIKDDKKIKKREINKNIDSLINRRLLKRKIARDGTISIELTKRGVWEVGIRNYFKDEELKTKNWDGKWRIVAFDVPEEKRIIRGELRRAVGLFGFTKLQQSVWVYPFPCDEFIELIRSHLGIRNDVLYITACKIENDEWLKKEFNLH